jgi:hypothetical protein
MTSRSLVDLLSVMITVGGLSLAASEYVNCRDLYLDGFWDLAQASQNPIFPSRKSPIKNQESPGIISTFHHCPDQRDSISAC